MIKQNVQIVMISSGEIIIDLKHIFIARIDGDIPPRATSCAEIGIMSQRRQN